jgi:hypothetical protein
MKVNLYVKKDSGNVCARIGAGDTLTATQSAKLLAIVNDAEEMAKRKLSSPKIGSFKTVVLSKPAFGPEGAFRTVTCTDNVSTMSEADIGD